MHDHDHDHPHTHEIDPLDAAIDPPAEKLLAALREQWLTDRQTASELSEQLLIARETVKFQNEVIRQLTAQVDQLSGGKA